MITSADGNTLFGSMAGIEAAELSNYIEVSMIADNFLENGVIPKQPEVLRWYSDEKGTYYNFPILGITDEGIITKNTGRKPKVFAYSKLQPGAVKFAKRYTKALEDRKFDKALTEIRADFIFPEKEVWTSSTGRETKAQFVSLIEETLTLEVNKVGLSKKNHSLTLDKLDDASQAKAKKWQEILTKQTEQEEEVKAKFM